MNYECHVVLPTAVAAVQVLTFGQLLCVASYSLAYWPCSADHRHAGRTRRVKNAEMKSGSCLPTPSLLLLAPQNELAMLEFIHCFVEVLDKHFGQVCELDIMNDPDCVHYILDEMLANG